MSGEEPAKRPRGRPRKPFPNEVAARPAHRPPVAFRNDPDRFAVTLALALEAQGMKASRAREIAAIIFGEGSSVALVPKAKWDASERSTARDHKKTDGAFLRFLLRPDLDADESRVAPDLDSATRKMRRKVDALRLDAEGTAWVVNAAMWIFALQSPDPRIKAGARLHLIYQGFSAGAVDLIADIFS